MKTVHFKEDKKLLFLKWTNNTIPDRTIRTKDNKLNNDNDNDIIEHVLKENLDNNFNDKQIDFDRLVPEGFIKQNTKRDGQNEKLLSRGMMIQKNINPFLDTSKYINHLDAEENFLRPKDSNFT
jgi:hypothetical protein